MQAYKAIEHYVRYLTVIIITVICIDSQVSTMQLRAGQPEIYIPGTAVFKVASMCGAKFSWCRYLCVHTCLSVIPVRPYGRFLCVSLRLKWQGRFRFLCRVISSVYYIIILLLRCYIHWYSNTVSYARTQYVSAQCVYHTIYVIVCSKLS